MLPRLPADRGIEALAHEHTVCTYIIKIIALTKFFPRLHNLLDYNHIMHYVNLFTFQFTNGTNLFKEQETYLSQT